MSERASIDDVLFGGRVERAPHPAALGEQDLLRSCDVERGRSGGPGGQHRNKVETAVLITHRPTGLVGRATERRSAEVNRRVALRRLRLLLATEHREPVPSGDVRSDLWVSRCRARKIACNPRHADYPALLGEAMDMLAASAWDPKRAAVRLECSASQLVRLIKAHPPAFARVNAAREDAGQHALR